MLTAPSRIRTDSSSQRRLRRGNVEFVFDVADQLLENIFDGDHAGGGAEFVDHYREVTAALFEFVEQFGQDFGFGNDQNIVHDLADLSAGDARWPEAGQD